MAAAARWSAVLVLTLGPGCADDPWEEPVADPTPPITDADPPEADAAPAEPAPIADPITAEPVASGLTVRLEEIATMPRSEPSPEPSDPRLRRWCRINYLGELPDGSGRLFVPDLNGTLYLLRDRTPQVYLELAALVGPDFWNHRGLGTGFGFVAFHPDFATNGRFYTVHTEARAALTTRTPSLPSQPAPSHHGVVTEWTAADPAADGFTGRRRELLRIGFRSYIHGIQEIGFQPGLEPGDPQRGLLYLAVGDGGAGLASGDAQNLGMPHGKLLRIDPTGTDTENGRYRIPATNPFVGQPGALAEIFASGLRDPHRFSWESGPEGRLLLANIGEHNVESIYEVRPGDNFGWPHREGPFVVRPGDPTCSVYPLPADDAAAGFTYPIAAYDHDPAPGFTRCVDTGDAVAGGFVYMGKSVPELQRHYVFGDIVTGRLFHALASELRRGGGLAGVKLLTTVDPQGQPVDLQTMAGDPRVDLRFGQDAGGELYVLSKANGKVWRMVAR